MTVFVDANVLLDVVTANPEWSAWSLAQLDRVALNENLVINDIVYAEISVSYNTVEELDALVDGMRLQILPVERAALFLAAKVHQRYRKAGGTRTGVLPDFFIGAQASLLGLPLLTRDASRYRTYFPQLELIAP